MKAQTGLMMGLGLTLVIAIFAVINVHRVDVNFLFGTAEWPLVLVILVSVLLGTTAAGCLAMIRIYRLRAEVRRLRKAQDEQADASPSPTAETNREADAEHPSSGRPPRS